jgi:uncharacterized coiled-coil DUF342 family protein
MSDFKPIETQEALDEIIKSRLERAKESVRKEYADYDDLKTKASNYDTKVGEYEAKIKELSDSIATSNKELGDYKAKFAQYETDSAKRKIAAEYKLPEQMAARLNGADEDAWRKDAESLAKLFKQPYPSMDTHEPLPDKSTESLLNLAKQLKGE